MIFPGSPNVIKDSGESSLFFCQQNNSFFADFVSFQSSSGEIQTSKIGPLIFICDIRSVSIILNILLVNNVLAFPLRKKGMISDIVLTSTDGK